MRFRVVMVCQACEEVIVGLFERTLGADVLSGSPAECPANPTDYGFSLTDTYPKPALVRAPEYINDQLKSYYMQAVENVKRRWDASGAMSRKVVDVSVKQLLKDEATKYRTMNDRIDALAKRGRLTEDLRTWAHEVRLGGNDAAHDEDPFTKEEAAELLDFVELYLTYVYTLPGRLAARRRPKEGGDAS